MGIVLSSPVLRDAGFAHGFSTRAVDLSVTSPYDVAAYADALSRFAREAGFDASALRHANQVHGATVVLASDVALDARPDADALVSFGHLAVGVRVADCVPVLVADRRSGAVAAIHAGWKGFVAGVVPAAIQRLFARERTQSDAPPPTPYSRASGLIAAIGPSIGPCCFEVGADVARSIEDAAGARVSSAGPTPEKRFVDLRAAVRAHLIHEGIAPACIDDVGACTRCDEARFFSFRRNGERGRMLAAIAPLTAPLP